MYNNEKRNSKYDEQYAEFEPEMTSARNARVRTDRSKM